MTKPKELRQIARKCLDAEFLSEIMEIIGKDRDLIREERDEAWAEMLSKNRLLMGKSADRFRKLTGLK